MEAPLTGRDAERATLLAALRDEHAGGVVVVGSPGVGKTRLAEEAAAAAAKAGRPVARVTGTQAAAELPLGAFAPLLPELGNEPPNLLSWARTRLLERAAGGRLVLLVDDAHTLDPVSAALVASMAGDRSAFVVVTVRRDVPVADAITSLWKDGHAERIDLLRLDDPHVVELAAGFLGGPVEPASAEVLCELASGNPMALRELLLGARAAGRLSAGTDGRWTIEGMPPVTPRLAELVSVRLAALDDDGRRGLELVALAEPIPVAVLADLCGGDDVPATLEEKWFVEVRRNAERVDEVWLRHALHGEVLRSELTPMRRRRLLGQLVDAFERNGGVTDQLRVAVWSMELGRPGDPDRLEGAARRAWIATDLDRCAALAGAAWEARPTAESGHLWGRALCGLQRHDDAEGVLVDAEGLAATDRERTMIAMARSENLFRSERRDEALAVVEATLATVADPDWHAELAGHAAVMNVLAGRLGPGLDVPAVTGPLERREGRPFVQAAIAAGTAWPWIGRPDDAVELAVAAATVHEELVRQDLFQSVPAVHLGTLLMGMLMGGRLDEAWELGLAARSEAGRRGALTADAHLSFLLGYVALLQGRPRTAVDQLRRAIAAYRRWGPVHRRRWALALLVEAAVVAGDLDAATLAEEELAPMEGSVLRLNRSGEQASRAWLEVGTGRFDEARKLLDAAADEGIESGWLSGAVAALHRLARVGGAEAGAGRAQALRERVQGALLTTQLDHVLALAARDPVALEAVAARFEAIGAWVFAAEAWTEACSEHRRAGDPRKAAAASRESGRCLERCEPASTPSLAIPVEALPLSRREREVAVLAAQGLSSQAIAEKLYLSRRTVENHLQHAYDKLGVRGRAELAEALGVVS